MVNLLFNAVKIIFLLGFLVFIHELGHFCVAKAFKVKIKEFAIGFGPTIWKKTGKKSNTKYALRLIPVGGFVNMLGEDERSEEEGAYNKLGIPKRILILLAGGTVNIIFGLVVYFSLIFTTGTYITTTIDDVIPGYAAEYYGLQKGDKILKINGKSVKYKAQIDDVLNNCNGSNLEIIIERNGEKQTVNIIPTVITNKSIGIYLGVEGQDLSTEIKGIYENTPAQEAGIQPGDIITHINGTEVKDAYHLVELIDSSSIENIEVTLIRNDSTQTYNLKPDVLYKYYLGIYAEGSDNTFADKMYYAFWNTVDFSTSIIDNLKEMFGGKISKEQLMGPVGISSIVVQTRQVEDYLFILAVISVSLGVTNLLPVPPLDGGKIAILLIEAIRRKPLKEQTEISIQLIGMALFMMLALFVTYNDVLRIF